MGKHSHYESMQVKYKNNFALKMSRMKTEYQNKVIAKIKYLREKAGYSQASIAKLLEISTGQLGNIESFKQPHKYTLSQIMKICEKLKIDIEFIFLNEDELTHFTTRNLIMKIVEYQKK